MKRCSKCNIEKELDQFDKYFHSTQNKERIRGYCKSCFKEQKRIYKESIKNKKIIQPVEDLTPPVPIPTPSLVTEEYKTCNTCFKLKPISDYYKRAKVKTYNRCKVCELAKEKAERLEYMDENSGSERVPPKPNVYNDEFQKRDTFLMMQALGYTFNEEKGIWYKEPWKTKDGKFLLLKKYDRLSNVGMKPISTEKIKKIYDLYDKGYTRKYIAAELEITKTTVCKYLNKKKYE